ncbi:MAG: hypothetical protein ABSF26_28470 [Thermoguttaceae bacterium]
MSTTTAQARAARLAAIVAAAEVYRTVGQAAHHELLDDGQHRVTLYDRTAGKLLVGVGQTVAQAVAELRKEPSK